MNEQNKSLQKNLVIRVGTSTLSFLVPKEDGSMAYHPYPVKSGMSLAANLREAFKEQDYLHKVFPKTIIRCASPIVLVPLEDYENTQNFDVETMYSCVMTGHKGEEKIVQSMSLFDCVALFSVNKDLKMVVTDNCSNVKVENIMPQVWAHFYKRYYHNGERRKMFVYFHDKKMDISSFEQRRIHFANSFDAQHVHDALYYLLFAWKQMGMNQNEDDLFIIGDIPEQQWLHEHLATYVSKVHFLNPVLSLNRSELSQIPDISFDLML